MLQGVARRQGIDLKTEATILYGAPPLLSAKALEGEHDGTLTFCIFGAELEGRGFKRAIDMEAIEKRLGASCPVAMIGYAFNGDWAGEEPRGRGAIPQGRCRGEGHLAASPDEWLRLAPRIGVTDKSGLETTATYSQGVPRCPIADEETMSRRFIAYWPMSAEPTSSVRRGSWPRGHSITRESD